VLIYSHEGRVAIWTLSQPPVNAINDEWLIDFHRTLDDIESKGRVSVLHIRSAQKTFCAGIDLKLMQDCFAKKGGTTTLVAMVARMQELFDRIAYLEQVTLVELSGAALGGGLELALACDFRIAAAEAKLGLTEISLGLVPGAGGTQRLSKLCGPAIARRLILRGEVIDGVMAEQLGVVHWAVPREQLQARVKELLDGFADTPARALAECKRCLMDYESTERNGFESELSSTKRLYEDPETRERVAAFLAKK
jgi:enoyl-CoA hydratase